MSMRELVYRVSMGGASEFARDLKSLTDLIRKSGLEEVALARAASNAKRQIRSEEQKHDAALLRTNIALEKARAKASKNEAEKSAKDIARTATQGIKERDRAADSAAKASIRRMVEEGRAFERAEREKTRIAKREGDTRTREMERAANAARRISEREARDRMFDVKRFARGIGMGAAGGIVGVARTGAGMVGAVGGALGLGAAFDVNDIVGERMYAAKLMRSTAIEARGVGQTMNFDEAGGLQKVRATALKYGISQRDLLGAIDAASEKGSGADAVKNLDRIAKQATAMGTDTTTISKMRAQIKMSSVTAGKELDDDKIDKMMAQMHFIGKTGVFRAEDIAKESESLISSFTKGGGDLETGWQRYMTFSNEARKSVGSGAMARTAIMGVQDAIAKKEGKINALGIKTRDEEGGQRDFVEIAMDVITKTGGKGDKFNKIFDPSKAGKALATMVTQFNAAGGQKDSKAGRAAMEKLLANDAGLKDATAEMEKDAALRMDTQGTSMAQSVEKVRQTFAEVLEPVMKKFAENAPAFASALAKVASFAIDNPKLAAVGALAAGGAGGAAKPLLQAGLRFAGDIIGSKVGGLGNMLTSAGSTPVFVTGAAPGVMGGGMPGMPGGGGGVPGGMMGAALAGGPLAMMGGVAALTVAGAAAAGALFDLYRTTETYKTSLDELAKKRVQDWDNLEQGKASGRGGLTASIGDDLDGIGETELNTKHGNVGKGFFGFGGGKLTTKLLQDRESAVDAGVAGKAIDKSIDQAFGTVQPIDIRGGTDNASGAAIFKALGVEGGGSAKLVGPAAEGTQDIAAAHAAESVKNMKDAAAAAKELSDNLKEAGRSLKNLPVAPPMSSFRMTR